ncbi:MAG: CotH protein [Bacteroidota bacterium]|jgi:hypothetical protein|nr:CotH protein [Bacteroidota bacterium]
MKSIKSTGRAMGIPLRLFVLMVFLLAVSAFILSLKFSGAGQTENPILKPDPGLKVPECDKESGFYPQAFTIKLSSSSKIYYTLDGSEPSLKSNLYTGHLFIEERTDNSSGLSFIPTSTRWKPPLNGVFKGTVLRAISVDENNRKSIELVRNFFVHPRSVNRYSIPVITITVDPDDFFGYSKGIYVMGKKYEDKDFYLRKHLSLNMPWWDYPANYRARGIQSERNAHVELFENGVQTLTINTRIRINGNATRGFSQKSLRVLIDNAGEDSAGIHYELFPGYRVHKFNSFILRNGGNDWDKTMFRDALIQSVMKHSDLDIQQYRPTVVFINGEYWGVHNLREKLDEHYLSNKHDLNTDSLSILEFDGVLAYGQKKDSKSFKDLLAFVRTHDLGNSANYNYVTRQIDTGSFMDFIIANVYFCNSDWPNNNVRFWRYRAIGGNDSLFIKDGRWRWMLYDTDWGFGYTGKEAVKMDLLERASKIGSIGVLFSSLIRNDSFRSAFKQRFLFHLDHTFNVAHINKQIDGFANVLDPEMTEHINRWRSIGSYEQWKDYVLELREFAKLRNEIQRQQLNQFIKKAEQ